MSGPVGRFFAQISTVGPGDRGQCCQRARHNECSPPVVAGGSGFVLALSVLEPRLVPTAAVGQVGYVLDASRGDRWYETVAPP